MIIKGIKEDINAFYLRNRKIINRSLLGLLCFLLILPVIWPGPSEESKKTSIVANPYTIIFMSQDDVGKFIVSDEEGNLIEDKIASCREYLPELEIGQPITLYRSHYDIYVENKLVESRSTFDYQTSFEAFCKTSDRINHENKEAKNHKEAIELKAESGKKAELALIEKAESKDKVLSEIKSLKTKKEALEKQVAELTKSLENIKKKHESSEQALTESNAKIDTLNATITTLKKEKQAEIDKAVDFSEQISILEKSQTNACSDIKKKWQGEVEAQALRHARQLDSWREQIDTQAKKIQSLNQSLLHEREMCARKASVTSEIPS